jgi:hypothetical protein
MVQKFLACSTRTAYVPTYVELVEYDIGGSDCIETSVSTLVSFIAAVGLIFNGCAGIINGRNLAVCIFMALKKEN